MLTLNQAIELATKAHKDQWRNPKQIFGNDHPLSNSVITLLQQNNQTDFTYEHNGLLYSMNVHLELFIQEPYITHPLAIMNMMSTDEEKIVAVLHDVIEDTDCKLRIGYDTAKIHSTSLGKFRIPLNVAYALDAITKKPSEEYRKFILRVADNKLATKVKIADIIHNLSGKPSKHAKQKYLKAIPILLKEI